MLIKSQYLIIFLLSLLCFKSYSQKNIHLKGIVTDLEGNKIKNANISVPEISYNAISDNNGEFNLSTDSTLKITVQISHVNFKRFNKKINLNTNKYYVFKLKSKVLKTLEVEYKDPGSSPIELLPTIDATNMALPSSNIEGLLSSVGFGVRQNNELSSGFSVRGGNFDENLIYVNGIEVYRPFLARSGQQEGLSFINPSMVDDILFSAGGFDAEYGDKLSSVLDITYREPKSFEANITSSLLGTQLQFGDKPTNLFTYNIGFRYRTNAYLLGALDTKGEYRPRFADFQSLLNLNINENLKLTVFGTATNNLFSVKPENRETNFGSINEALRFTVYYDGQENTQFKTYMGTISLDHKYSDYLTLKYFVSAFNTHETEFFDVLGQYSLDELETDLGSDDYGQIAYNRGVGGFLNHARNEIIAQVYNLYHRGYYNKNNQKTSWGVKAQKEFVNNSVKEWKFIDSARYNSPRPLDSINYTDPTNIPYEFLNLNNLIFANNEIASSRITGFLQHKFRFSKDKKIQFSDSSFLNGLNDTSFVASDYFTTTVGVRGNYWTFNQQTVISPRINLKWKPAIFRIEDGRLTRKNVSFKIASGFYYQPPFYRAARNLLAELNPLIRAQKSIHFVVGGDLVFKMWDRKFKAGTELYYKILRDIIPYEIENVRVNYYGTNSAEGYARGIDLKINGEFIRGLQSYASLSWLQTEEDILNDYYYNYYNSSGEKIISGYTYDQVATDSVLINPSFIPRPTDQRLSFSMFFQDQMPSDWDTEKIKWSNMKVNLNLLFGTRLPYGPPGSTRYSDTLRSSFYKRIDIGFSKDLINSESDKSRYKSNSILHKIKSLSVAFEVFNLLDISNTTNYTWINDVSGRKYSIPSFLTSRRLNLKLVARF
tara:strand:- start:18100 stop:20751 length:2652 start_codon:yes stop_codon:yes gene_type:complete